MHSEILEQADHEFLLVCEATTDPSNSPRGWRFALEHLDGRPFLEAQDEEEGDRNRLALWAVVRGLEALPGPSSVTMLTGSRYVIRSMSDSLPRWRASGFQWEHFGTRLPVSNADLWRRVDRVLEIHQVSACFVAAARQLGTHRHVVPGPSMETHREGAQRPERSVSVADGLRRWLLGQCGIVGPGTNVGRFAVA